jgi:transcriptional regulator with XRE-family HTH domain
MPVPPFKNYLRTYRKKLGLTQREVAEILGFKSAGQLCDLELGSVMPTTRDCVAFGVLYKRSFRELWPNTNSDIETQIDNNIRHFIKRLQTQSSGPQRKRRTANELVKTLQAIVDGLPEDVANVI